MTLTDFAKKKKKNCLSLSENVRNDRMKNNLKINDSKEYIHFIRNGYILFYKKYHAPALFKNKVNCFINLTIFHNSICLSRAAL